MLAGAAVSEKMRIRSNGNIWLGGLASEPQGPALLNGAVAGNVTWAYSFIGYGNVSSAPAIAFSKTRNASPTAHTVVQLNDLLGYQAFYGSDGAAFVECARIMTYVDNTPASGKVPSAFQFVLQGDNGGLTQRLKIDRNGQIITSQATYTLPTMAIGDMVLTPTGNGSAQLSYKGSDSVIRSATFTLT
jgi:hypothetical protein